MINASKRQLIPRWHTSRKMAFVQQLTASGSRREDDNSLLIIEEKKRLWERYPSLASATDLFVSLKLANMTSDLQFKKTGSYLLLKSNEVSDAVKDIVSPRLRKLDPSNNYTTNKERIYVILNILKGFVKDCPYDSLTWNDLAFYYAVIGEKHKAEHCMNVSYNLSSSHPFIARSYARLLVHYEDPEKAIHILKKTGAVKSHPEILSADISIRTAFDIRNPDITTARRLINKYSNRPCYISELSASIGTIEVESGSLIKGKTHLAASAISPTENTVAQLKWISQQHNIFIPIKKSSIQSLEADAITYYNNKEYSNCRDSLMTLHRFQPFSEGALVDAGYVSMVALDDPEFVCDSSEYFGDDVVASFSARNNYIVARLEIGILDNTEEMLLDLRKLAQEEENKAVLSAAIGMYLYRIGDIDGGKKKYEITNAFFRVSKNYFSLALALLHQGMMEKRLGIGSAKTILEQAKKEAKKASKSPELLAKIKRELASIEKDQAKGDGSI